MAKDLNRSIKIIIDHSDAMKKASDFESKIEKVNQKLNELNNQGKKDDKEYKAQEKTLRQLTAQYDRWKAKVAETERVLKNLSGATRGELLQVQRQLKKSLDDCAYGSDVYKARLQALIAVEKQLTIIKKEMNGTMGKNATLWSRMADGFNKYFGIATSVIAGITGISLAFRKLAENVAEMDDIYSDVIKTTFLTREEVLELNESFKNMDTRTAREELNRLARDAGKLGITGSKNILDFVEAGNQITVALGQDLGDGAIKSIGKMTDVYAKSTKELDAMDLKGKMLAIGSAINELGMSSTASEKYMVSFAQRLGGVASQAGISIQNILGYASALDQSGQAVEMSATAMQKFIMKLMSEPTKFAQLAGLEVKAFNELLAKDTNAAIKQVLSALSQKGGFQALIPVFKDMGLDGARAVGVLSALATNINKIDEAQTIANKAFADGTSVTNEYSIKNTNLNAQLEKARKNFKDAALELGEKLNPALLRSTKWTTHLIKAMPTVLNFFEKYGKYILYITVVGGAYVAGIKLQTLWNTKLAAALTLSNIQLKLKSALLIAAEVATHLYWITVSILTGRLNDARRSFIAFCTVLKTSPIGVAAALVTALGLAIYNYTQRTKEAVTQAKRLEEVNNEAARSISAERNEINLLLSVAQNEKISKEERLKAIERLNEISPEYLGNLKLENINTQAATESVKKYTEELLKNARAKTIQNKIQAESDKMFDLDEQIMDKRRKIEDLQQQLDEIENGKVVSPSVRAGITNRMANETILITRLEKERDAIQETMDMYSGFYQDIYQTSPLKKQETEFQKLNKLLQEQADLFNKVNNNKDALYNATQKRLDKERLNMLAYEIEAQKKLAEAEANRMKDDKEPEAYTPPVDPKEAKKLAAQQKKELSLILEGLETVHLQRVADIKEKYRNGEIDSESDFNTQLFAENSAYYLLQEKALSDHLKKVSDKALRSDIEKQLSTLRNKQVDEEIAIRKKIQQIILDANPEEKERIAYENRLRDVGLYGADRATLTKEQLDALELLEQQHENNLLRIRNDAKRKQKAASEEEFENKFKQRKEQLQQELADEEHTLAINKGFGTMSNAKIFNEEVALQEKKIAMIKEEAEARKAAGLDISNVLKKQRTEELNLTKLYINEFQRRRQQYTRYATDMGTALGNLVIGQEDALRSFANVTLDILFDTLTQIINAEIVKVTATGASAIARGTAEAMATPGSALTFGAKGFATAAILTAAITGAMTVAKTALKGLLGKKNNASSSSSGGSTTTYKRVVSQQREGKYDVIGQDDKKLYKKVPFAGTASTGIVHTPTLIAEDGGELVVSSPDLRALQKHINYPLIVRAINDVRAGVIPQRASGKYDVIEQNGKPAPSETNFMNKEIYLELLQTMKALKDKEFDFNYYEFERKNNRVQEARKLATRK